MNEIIIFKQLEKTEQRYRELEEHISSPEIATDPKQLMTLAQERAGLEDVVSKYRRYRDTAAALSKTEAMLSEEKDE